jgi:hypothetical protein
VAARPLRLTHRAPVINEEMREVRPLLPRDELHQIGLDLDRILVARKAEALRKAAHMRIDDDPLWLAQLGGPEGIERRLEETKGNGDG